MLRTLFSADDIARTRIAARADPLWEVMLGLHMLRRQRGDLYPLHTLVASPPRPQQAGRHASAPRFDIDARTGAPAAVGQLTQSLRAFHDVAITPHRRRIGAALDRDRGIRLQAMRDGGVEALFASLHPAVRWSAGELQVLTHRDQELHLGGRGLLLIPSYFNVVTPLTLFEASLPPVLIYPVERSPGTVVTASGDSRGSLGPLIGHTRRAILLAVATGRSTSDLGREAGVSVGSASEHASVLRAAGLITSCRDRNRMVHQLTSLGMQLLEND